MRKPENKEKFEAAIAAMITFYGRRDKKMVAEVLSQEAEKARSLEVEWWEKRVKREKKADARPDKEEDPNLLKSYAGDRPEMEETKHGETRT